MKILIVCQYFFPEQFRINDICKELKKEGHEITVLTGLPNYPLGSVPKEYKFFKKRKENLEGIKIYRCFEIGRKNGIIFRFLNYFSFMVSSSIKALLLREKYDVVLVYQLSPIFMAIPGLIYKKKKKIKLFLYCLDLWPNSITAWGVKENSLIYKVIKKISKSIYRNADEILISSTMFKEELENLIGKKQFIYLPQYAEGKLSISNKISQKENRYVFAGNIGKVQSVETIIMAANELREQENIFFDIVGDGSNLATCKKIACELNLQNVIFHGKKDIDEMQEFYDKADAMLVTLSKDEFASKTLPAKVQACMATRNAIIGAANGEVPNVIYNSKCGFCTNAEDYKGLAEIILKYSKLSDSEKEQMRINSYNYYLENFEKKIIIEKMVNILKEGKDDKNV